MFPVGVRRLADESPDLKGFLSLARKSDRKCKVGCSPVLAAGANAVSSEEERKDATEIVSDVGARYSFCSPERGCVTVSTGWCRQKGTMNQLESEREQWQLGGFLPQTKISSRDKGGLSRGMREV